MSADAITTCPNCLDVTLRENWDLYCEDENGKLVYDDEDPPVRPVTYFAHIRLECRACSYEADLRMSSPLTIEVVS